MNQQNLRNRSQTSEVVCERLRIIRGKFRLILFAAYKRGHCLKNVSFRAEKDRGLTVRALLDHTFPQRSSFKGNRDFSLTVGTTPCYFFAHPVLLTAHF